MILHDPLSGRSSAQRNFPLCTFVRDVLHGGLVVGVLAEVKKLAKLKMITESCVFHGL